MASIPRMDIDEAIGVYSSRLRHIYDERTAGDYTFTGVLAEFVMTIRESTITEFMKDHRC